MSGTPDRLLQILFLKKRASNPKPLRSLAFSSQAYACEWNPNALEALRRNLKANGVEGRGEVRRGVGGREGER